MGDHKRGHTWHKTDQQRILEALSLRDMVGNGAGRLEHTHEQLAATCRQGNQSQLLHTLGVRFLC